MPTVVKIQQKRFEEDGISVIRLRKGVLELSVELEELREIHKPAFAAMRVRTCRKPGGADMSPSEDFLNSEYTVVFIGANEAAGSARRSVNSK